MLLEVLLRRAIGYFIRRMTGFVELMDFIEELADGEEKVSDYDDAYCVELS